MNLRTSRFAEELAADDAKRIAELPPDLPIAEQPQAPSGPRYLFWRPWWVRLAGKGCRRCNGGEPPGWVQRQIETPYRFKRFVLWTVNLIPRGVSMIRVVTSKRVSSAQYAERQASCGECPSAVIQLRVRGGKVHERKFCSMCSCPHWAGSELHYKNRKAAHHCPLKLHAGSDRDARLIEHVRAKAAQANGDSSNGR